MAKAQAQNDVTPSTERPATIADAPFLVRATQGGTYPDPGSTLARWREIGAVFEVKCIRDFSNRWMKRLTDGEAAEVKLPTKVIPQTTAKSRKIQPFPQP